MVLLITVITVKTMAKKFNVYPETIKMNHFNGKYKEFMNVYVSNMRDKYGHIYDGKQWIIQEKKKYVNLCIIILSKN